MKRLIAAFPETKEIGKRVAKALKCDFTEIIVEDFPDSEFHLRLEKNPKDKEVIIISSIIKEVDNKIVETILAGGIARDYKAKKITLVATYFPYMRQDKHFEKYDSFSARYISKLFSNFDEIIAIDPHLHRIHNMKQLGVNARNITTNKILAEYIKKRFRNNFTIIGPDSESSQWSANIAGLLKKKVVILNKTRFSGTKIKQKDFSGELNENVIIIDDIISTGKTLAGALELAKKHGAKKLFCIGIHGVLVNDAEKLITKYAELITTNTIPNKYAKIDVSSVIAESLR